MITRYERFTPLAVICVLLLASGCARTDSGDTQMSPIAPPSSRADALALVPSDAALVVVAESPLRLLRAYAEMTGDVSDPLPGSTLITDLGLPSSIDPEGTWAVAMRPSDGTCAEHWSMALPVLDWTELLSSLELENLEQPTSVPLLGQSLLLSRHDAYVLIASDVAPGCAPHSASTSLHEGADAATRQIIDESDLVALVDMDQLGADVLRRADLAIDVLELLPEGTLATGQSAALSQAFETLRPRISADGRLGVLGATLLGDDVVFSAAVQFHDSSEPPVVQHLFTATIATETIFQLSTLGQPSAH